MGAAIDPAISETGTNIGSFTVGSNPSGIAFDPQSGTFYVANEAANSVSVISASSEALVTTVTGLSSPVALAYDSANGDVYVSNGGVAAVTVISSATNTVVATVSLGSGVFPSGIAYDPSNSNLYVATDYESSPSPPVYLGALLAIDASTNLASTVASFVAGATATPQMGVAFDAGNGTLYVTVGAVNEVVEINPMTDTEVASVPTGTNPVGVAYDAANGAIYVANSGSGNVTIIDASTNKIVATVSVGTSPRGDVFDASNLDVYVSNFGSDSVSALSGASNRVIGTIPSGPGPEALAVDAGNGLIAVADSSTNLVSAISTTLAVGPLGPVWNSVADAGLLNGTLSPGSGPRYSAFDSANGELYITDGGTNAVSAFATATGALVATIPVGAFPMGIAYDAANGAIYVADGNSKAVSVVAGSSDAVVATVSVGVDPYGVSYDGGNGNVYVSNTGSNNLTVIRGSTNSVVGNVSVGSMPRGVAYDSRTGNLYVADSNASSVSVVGGSDDSVVATVAVGAVPLDLAYDAANGDVYVSNFISDDVRAISDATNTVVATVSTGAFPAGVAYDTSNGELYVADSAAGLVTVIDDTSNSVAATLGPGGTPWGISFDDQNGNVYVANVASSTVAIVSSLGAVSYPSTAAMDVGQTERLSATVVGQGAGLNRVTWVVSPSTGLACRANDPGGGSVSGSCRASVPGDYLVTLTATDDEGSSVSTTLTLVVDAAPTLPSPQPSRAAGDVGQLVVFSTAATGGSGVFPKYVWQAPSALGCPGSVSGVLVCLPSSPALAGEVSVRAIDTSGLTTPIESAAYTVSADPRIGAPTASPTTLDVGGLTTLSVAATNGTGAPSTYAWFGLPPGCTTSNATTIACSPSSAGTFAVTATIQDSNGFNVSSTPLTLDVSSAVGPPAVTVSRAGLDVGQSVVLSATVSGGALPLEFVWDNLPTGCVSSNSSTVFCQPSSAGRFSVSVTITDANGVIAASSTVMIAVAPALAAANLTASPFAQDIGGAVTLSVDPIGGSGGLGYTWSGLPAGCATASTRQLACTPRDAGTYPITVDVTDSNGAHVAVGPVMFTVDPALTTPSVTSSAASVREGSELILSADVAGGVAPLTFRWSGLPSGCASVNATTLSCDPNQTGSYNVTVSVTDAAGLVEASTPVRVIVSSVPAAGFFSGASGFEWLLLASVVILGVLVGAALAYIVRSKGRTQGKKRPPVAPAAAAIAPSAASGTVQPTEPAPAAPPAWSEGPDEKTSEPPPAGSPGGSAPAPLSTPPGVGVPPGWSEEPEK